MKTFPICISLLFLAGLIISCGSQPDPHKFRPKDTTVNNPHKVEDSAKVIIERAHQNIKDSLKQ